MRLVIDASTLVAEALRVRGRRLIAHGELDLILATEAWNETEHELGKRVGLLVDRGFLDRPQATALPDVANTTLTNNLVVAPRDLYQDRLPEARWRIPSDVNDAPTVALALTLDFGIWTGDRDFFGCGLPVWSTDVLLRYLEPSNDFSRSDTR